MDFRQASDRLMEAGVTLPEIAEALGAAYTTVRAWRLDPGSASFRAPPPGWEPKLARLARKRASTLQQLADQLERRAEGAAGKRARTAGGA